MRKFLLYFLIVFSIFAIVAYIAWFPSPLESPFRLAKTWGVPGSKNGQFNLPTDIAIVADTVYVCDSQNARIQVFNLDGEYLREIGNLGIKDQKLIEPVRLVVSDNQVFVIDKFSKSIKVYSIQGEFISEIIPDNQISNVLNSRGGFDINLQGNFVFANSENHLVTEFSKQGTLLRQWGLASGQFNSPADVIIDKRGFLYITDTGNQRIQVFNDKGDNILKWGAPFSMNLAASFNGWFNNPSYITTGPEMTIFVVDFNNDRVQKFTSGGTFLTAFDIDSNDRLTSTKYPEGISIAVTEMGDVYLADQNKNQIQIWTNKLRN